MQEAIITLGICKVQKGGVISIFDLKFLSKEGGRMYNGIMKVQKELIEFIYDPSDWERVAVGIERLIGKWGSSIDSSPREALALNEGDVVMISYGDSIQEKGRAPLATLKDFADTWLTEQISGIHLLPFSPYTSDDGFSVVDYRQINPDWGTWEDVERLREKFELMFDLVLNHCSASSPWFKSFLEGDPKYGAYFHTVDPSTDLSKVFRPRALPLLTEFDAKEGKVHIWTTFSPDQVDLNFANPEVFLEFLDILLMYIARGAKIVRLDAIGFLWKEIGTSCMHHPKTHGVVQLYRSILDKVAPQAILLTETNVPHEENISYFGEGANEAHMVYQFSLPPLTLDAFIREDTGHLTKWASSLPPVNPDHTFFNFMSSHDGVGVLPARGFLSEEEMNNMIETVKSRGGRVSYKATPQGEIPYELNINYRDGINDPSLPVELKVKQFLSSQAIMLCMAGVPGIYVHSLLGSGNWQEGVKESGINRRINREKLDCPTLVKELEEPGSLRQGIYLGYRELLKVRRSHRAFHPSSAQEILSLDPGVFGLIRRARDGSESILCLQNVSARMLTLSVGRFLPEDYEVLLGSPGEGALQGELILPPYDVCWIRF